MKNKRGIGQLSSGAVVALLSLLVYVSLSTVSCSSIECPIQNKVELVCAVADTLKDTLTVTTRRSDGTDTVLLYRAQQVVTMQLPISQQHAVDKLVFKTERLAVTDTVWIEKEDEPHFESVDCSLAYFHHITSVRCTHLGIDTIVITKPNVDYDLSSSHLLFYFKARP